MKKNAFYFLAILVFLLIACAQIPNPPTKPAGPSPLYLAPCKEYINNSYRYGDCIRELLTDEAICYEAVDKFEQEDCFGQTAVNLRNFSICNNIEHGNNIDYEKYSYDLKYLNCYFGVAVKLANENKNSSYCDITLTKRDKDDCLWSLFILTKNPEVCNQIKDDNQRTKCLSSTKIKS